MTSIDRALRTLSRIQSAAPPMAAHRIGEVITLLQHLYSENELLNSQYLESLHSTDAHPSARGLIDRATLDELFQVDQPMSDLFGDVDPALFTDEMPAVAVRDEASFGSYPSHLDTITAERVQPDVAQEGDALPNADALLARLDDVFRPSLDTLKEQATALFDGRMGRLTSNQADMLRLMLSNASSLIGLLDSLNLVQQLRHHTLRLNVTAFAPSELLDRAQQAMREQAAAHDHQMSVQGDDVLPMVEADFDRTLVVLTDLLDNAIRYMPTNGVIRISADNLGTHVLFTISDTGIGFSAADSEHVGTPFWRALHEPLVQQHPGSGLRLFLARQILALQNGELFFSGEPGAGSTFSFTLLAAGSR